MYIVRRFQQMGYKPNIQSFKGGRNIFVQTPGLPKNGYTLVLAYYDGLGCPEGRLFPGADSNASGVAALLCLAQSCKGQKGVIFAAVDAHRANSEGASALKERLKGKKISAVISLDILGGDNPAKYSYWKDFLIILGGDGLKNKALSCNKGVNLHLYYDYFGSKAFSELFYRKTGDHRPFFGSAGSVVVFTSGITPNTNTTADTAQSINYQILSCRVDFIENWVKASR